MKSLTKITLAAAAILAIACGQQENDASTLKRNAITNESNNKVIKVKVARDQIDYVYVAGTKGYKLVCQDESKLNTLISATGSRIPAEEKAVSDPFVQGLNIEDQLYLTCDGRDQVFYKSELDGKIKYFVAGSNGNTRLHMIGCQELVDAMGLKVKDAKDLPAYLIDEVKAFTAKDEDDISCIQGIPVGAKVNWIQGKEGNIIVNAGEDIEVLGYLATLPDGSNAPLTLKSNGACDWINSFSFGSGFVISGEAPPSFYNQKCELTVTAAGNTPLADSRTLQIYAQETIPTLTTTCIGEYSVLESKDFESCEVKTDLGEMTFSSFPEESCKDVFTYENNMLILNELPLANQSCSASFQSDLNGVASVKLEIKLTRICDIGYVGNDSGTCERVACDDQHRFEDEWTIADSEKSANLLYRCEADGSSKNIGIASCYEGFEQRGDSCLKQCAPSFLDGDYRELPVGGGVDTQYCKEGEINSALKCSEGYINRNGSCLLSCDGIHVDLENWTESVTNGSQKKSCEGSKIISGGLTCNTNHIISGGSCKLSCDGTHLDKASWTVAVTGGKRSFSCSGINKVTGSVTCNEGYLRRGSGSEDRCEISCDSKTTVNETKIVDITGGKRTDTCQTNGKFSSTSVKCNSGFEVSGYSCKKTFVDDGIKPPPPIRPIIPDEKCGGRGRFAVDCL